MLCEADLDLCSSYQHVHLTFRIRTNPHRTDSALATVRAKQRLARAAFDQGVVGVVGAPAMPDLK